MKMVVSKAISIFMPSGSVRWICGSISFSAAEMSSGLATACLTTASGTALTPLKRAVKRSSSEPSSTRATSLSRTRLPLSLRRMTSPNCSGVFRSVSDSTVNSRSLLSTRPAGISTFCARSAFSTSTGVRPKPARRCGCSHTRMA